MRTPPAMRSHHTRSKFDSASPSDSGAARNAIVSATPSVPPNWRIAWFEPPPTPARFGGSDWATTLDELRETHRHAEAGEEHRGQVVRHVGGGRREQDQAPEAADREHHAAGDQDQRSLADAARELADERCEHRDERRAGGDGEAGPQDRVLPHLGAGRGSSEKNIAVNAVPNANDAALPHEKLLIANSSMLSAGAGVDAGGRRTRRAAPRPPRMLAMVRMSVQPHDSLCTSPSETSPAASAISATPSGAGIVAVSSFDSSQDAASGEDGEQPDRQVDEEHPPPARASRREPPRASDRARRRPLRSHPRSRRRRGPWRGERTQQERQRRRDQRGGADGLDDAEGDEHSCRRCEAAGHRRHREQRRTGQERTLVAEPVGELPGRHQERREDDGVGVEHPRQLRRCHGVERGDDVGEGDEQHRRVEEHGENRQRCDGECELRLARDVVGRRRGGAGRGHRANSATDSPVSPMIEPARFDRDAGMRARLRR